MHEYILYNLCVYIIDGYSLVGPYKETFTGLYVINLSNKVIMNSVSTGNRIVIVSTVSTLLSDLTKVVNSIYYPYEGFGAVIRYDNYQVLVWGDRDSESLYDENSGQFHDVFYMESAFYGHDLSGVGYFSYTDAQGI